MRVALCLFLLGSTALLSGCVDGGPSRSGVRYDDDIRYARSGYASGRPPRDNGERVPEYNEERRPWRAGSYERDMRPNPRAREDRRDLDGRNRMEETRRNEGDRDLRGQSNPSRDRRNPVTGRDPVCEYPCIR